MEHISKALLLRIAREAVVDAAQAGFGGRLHQPESAASVQPDSELRKRGAAFVTLHDPEGGVRGCVGTTAASQPLVDVVIEMARAAALRDPRFPPVRPEEVDDLELEISVLDTPRRLDRLEEVEIGRDGLLVVGRGERGLLLPQVAEERDWDAERFAEFTCRKAGLPPDAYRADDVALFRFGAEVFSERS